MKRILLVLVIILVGTAAAVVTRTLGIRSRQVAVAPVAPEPLDATGLAQRHSGGPQLQTHP